MKSAAILGGKGGTTKTASALVRAEIILRSAWATTAMMPTTISFASGA
jgi:MinD superfamily P-loop ATPase